jgi:hypothetical protein
MKRTFKIYRYDPERDAKPYMQTIEVELDGHERMLLDALMKIKAQDPTFSFRRSCRETDTINFVLCWRPSSLASGLITTMQKAKNSC